MADIWIDLPLSSGSGSPYWADSVATAGDLPASGLVGEAILVQDSGLIYYWDGAAWTPTSSAGTIAVVDTDSVDLTYILGSLSADLRLSANAADAGSQLVNLDIESTGSVGLRAQILDTAIQSAVGPVLSDALTDSHIYVGNASNVATDVAVSGEATLANTGAITLDNDSVINKVLTGYTSGPGTVTASDSIIEALQIIDGNDQGKLPKLGITDGSSAAVGDVGENLSNSVIANTSTGVGASGVYGNAVSLSLPAGDWMVEGVAGMSENGSVLTTGLQVGISASSSGAGIDEFYTQLQPYLVSSTSDALIAAPAQEFNVSSTTTVYLNTRFWYTSGTPQHRGMLRAKRIR